MPQLSHADNISLQLKWKHQFQFAGYYAALSQGYYQQEGLNVKLLEAQSAQKNIQTVLNGQAEYGVGTSNLLLERYAGKPVVVLGVIFQHSPFALITQADSTIHNIQDLAGKTIMKEEGASEIEALLQSAKLFQNQYQTIPHSFNTQDFEDRLVDAITVYSTDEPFILQKHGVPYRIFTPRSAGIDFYADNLYTTEQELKLHPKRVEAFMRASFKGWRYAMANPDEIIDILIKQYHADKSREALQFEASTMQSLMETSIIPPGYMYQKRWESIIQSFQSLGKLPQNFNIDGFLYVPQTTIWTSLWEWRWQILGYGIGLLLLMLILYNQSLRMMVKKRTYELLDSNHELNNIFNNMHEAIFHINTAGAFTRLSPAITHIMGYTPDALLTQTLQSYCLSTEKHQQLLNTYEQQTRLQDFKIQLKHKNGSHIWVSINAHKHINQQGMHLGIEGTLRDITLLQQAEDIILNEKHAAQKANADKTHFLATASHDLRQPLNALNLLLSALIQTKDTSNQHDILQQAYQSSQNLSELLTTLLDISQLDVHAIEASYQNIAVETVLQQISQEFQHQVKQKGLQWRVHQSQQNLYIKTDLVLLKRMLQNLLGNALKYTQTGGILLAVRPRKTCVYIEVWDTGCGIPKNQLDLIFTEFYQVNKQQNLGLGLGLSIVQRLSMILSHPISITSTLDQGSFFCIQIPLAPTTNTLHKLSIPSIDTHNIAAGLGVLIVDHHSHALDALAIWLQGWGCEIIRASSYPALMQDLQNQPYEVPDLIISEYHLDSPQTGTDLIHAVRKHFNQPIAAAITTTDSTLSTQNIALPSHTDFLLKPVQEQQLIALLHNISGD
ncbi:MAG: ABC transporter substrate-binding protein [Mariprofundaceae bacterium]|nr:ABC transporter substrate-binding protein [Mariprofundaceae bacterium]